MKRVEIMTKQQYLEQIFSVYTLVSCLSNKNHSEVLHLRHRKLNRDIVLRYYPTKIPAYVYMLGILHENLPEIYEVVDLEEGQIILEEFISGETVAAQLEKELFTYEKAKKVLTGVCAALAPLHEGQIVHRDIKPENIIINLDGKVKLLDFNASRTYMPFKRADTILLGTVGYAPPEQLGLSQSDTRTDIYALGILLNVMLTGTHPSEKLAKGKAGDIVLKCTQVSPERRITNVQNLIKML